MQDSTGNFSNEVSSNHFRNKNKKVEDAWSLEKLLKIFEDIRDHRQMMQNVFREKKN